MAKRTYFSILLLKIPPPTNKKPITTKPIEFKTIAALEEPLAKTTINKEIQANNIPIAIPIIITVFENIISNKPVNPIPAGLR